MKRFFLITLLIVSFYQGMSQDLNELLYSAKKACLSSNYKMADSLYSYVDSMDSITYFYDLYYYYVNSELLKDFVKSEKLLYRFVQSNAFERKHIQEYQLDYLKVQERPYWHKVDSLINVTESGRCQPFIDSLTIMAKLDQSVREMEWSDETARQMQYIDSINITKLMKLIEQYGFPTWKLVGQVGAINAWLIAQHSSYLPWYLKHLRKAVKENNAGRQELAYMEDRFLIEEGRPQIYGTQFMYSVIDSMVYHYATIDMEHLDNRRIAMEMYTMEDYLKRAEFGNVDLYRGYGNYMTTYYPNLNNLYLQIDYMKNDMECPDSVIFYHNKEIYWFPEDLEFMANHYYENDDITLATKLAKKMVWFGRNLNDEWNLPQPLMDTVKECYSELRADYERLINKEADAKIRAMTSFDTLAKFLDSGFYNRYEIDSWNNHIKKLIHEKAEILTKHDYQEFFACLFKQVEAGNYHLFDYAELYDEVHHRLFRTSYYGQKKFDFKVRIYKPKQLESRRNEIHLPSESLSTN